LKQLRWLEIIFIGCIFTVGCGKHTAKKPDPTKGRVTGIVLCADTGKPARFATVTLSALPRKDDKLDENEALPPTETTETDLDGRFKLEAVEPGLYYAFATLDGYLDPKAGIDFTKLNEKASGQERIQGAINQWKDHLVEVSVSVRRTADVALQIERGAEIGGTVTYDDGSPAIGMHIQLFRKTEKNAMTRVGLTLYGETTLAASNGHGHFNVTNLSAGEYTVCAMLPTDSQDAAPLICLGNTFRKKNAKTIKVQAGEVSTGMDIEIPLAGLHGVAGSATAAADGQPLCRGTVRLLYADDREKAREDTTVEDGSFSFTYVPEGKYILQVSDARDADKEYSETGSCNGGSVATVLSDRRYVDKEIPVTVLSDDVNDLQVQLDIAPSNKTKEP
jgi:5-hydroxyisourate hydrolase-like protein (transthyretin family)